MTARTPVTACRAAQRATQAAEALHEWHQQQRPFRPDGAPRWVEQPGQPDTDAVADLLAGSLAPPPNAPGSSRPGEHGSGMVSGAGAVAPPLVRSANDGVDGAAMHLPNTDWLHHRLVVSGPADTVAEFQASACGAGTIPWRLDLDRMQEDLFHRLVSPSPPQRRTLSIGGARMLASQLREAVDARHTAAVARVGRSTSCPLDLHALVPVPGALLQLGPDHPDALAWLWTHWGTTDALRHVAQEPSPALRTPLPPGLATLRIVFWSADWTPWRALAQAAARWPALHLDIRLSYTRP